MKIINMNKPQNNAGLYQAWAKMYCYDLDRKITSLYDFIIYNSPGYYIFNSPLSDDPYKSISDMNLEPRLKHKYQVDTQYKEPNGKVRHISFFFPYYLSWKQGFYNQSTYGDGVFVWGVDGDKDAGVNFYILDNNMLWRQEDQYVYTLTQTLSYGSATSWYVGQCDLFCTIIDGKRQVVDESAYHYNQDTQILEVDPGYCAVNNIEYFEIYNQQYLKKDFPSGYVCVLNTQPTGVNDSSNSVKLDISNYLVAPIGNGGYYNMYWSVNNFLCEFEKNDFTQFVNTITVNLATNCRYHNPKENQEYVIENQYTIDNFVENDEGMIVPYLSDFYKNIWDGYDILVGQTVCRQTMEDVFMDAHYDKYKSVFGTAKISTFNFWTPEHLKTNVNRQTIVKLQVF